MEVCEPYELDEHSIEEKCNGLLSQNFCAAQKLQMSARIFSSWKAPIIVFTNEFISRESRGEQSGAFKQAVMNEVAIPFERIQTDVTQ